MDITFFARGLLIGLSIAAVVGPMSVLCMQRTLVRGFRYGLISGLGVATADAFYGSIAAFGVTVIAALLVSLQVWIRLIGGGFLIYLGIKTLLSKPAERAVIPKMGEGNHTISSQGNHKGLPLQTVENDERTIGRITGYGGAYLSTLGLTLTNPLTILSFAAIFAGIGVAGGRGSAASALLVVLGVFTGSAVWWCALTGSVSLLRARLTPRWLVWINRASGAVIAAFGMLALLSLLHR
jgi:threonine/homoserine/homoserine lactone efflux protein